jgi:hypothetical protein
VRVRIGLKLATAAGAMGEAAGPLNVENATGKGARRRQIATAFRAGAEDGLASRGLAILAGNIEDETACGVFTDYEMSHVGQPPQSKNGYLVAGIHGDERCPE